MADLSNAFGTIIIRAEKMETLGTLITFLEKASEEDYGNYGMVLNGFESMINEYGNALKADFTGHGRWLFTATLECLLDNIKNYLSRNHQLVTALEAEQFSMEITYVDSSENDSILYKEEDLITHDADIPLEKSEFTVQYTEGMAWTWANHIALKTDNFHNLVRKDFENIVNSKPDEWDKIDVENFIDRTDSELPDLLSTLNYPSKEGFFKYQSWFARLYFTAKDKMEEWQ